MRKVRIFQPKSFERFNDHFTMPKVHVWDENEALVRRFDIPRALQVLNSFSPTRSLDFSKNLLDSACRTCAETFFKGL